MLRSVLATLAALSFLSLAACDATTGGALGHVNAGGAGGGGEDRVASPDPAPRAERRLEAPAPVREPSTFETRIPRERFDAPVGCRQCMRVR